MSGSVSNPFIETYTGSRFTPLQPRVEDVQLEDIAHALSHQCRFSGHTRLFYSVAEHSVRVSRAVQKAGGSQEEQLWGLLHDASEAYLVDVPKPLKDSAFGELYREAEVRIMSVVCAAFQMVSEQPDLVTRADVWLLATEARDLMPYRPENWGELRFQALEERIEPWSPQAAEQAFIRRYVELRS